MIVGLFAAAIGVPALIIAMAWLAIYADECRCDHCQERDTHSHCDYCEEGQWVHD